MSNDDKLAVLAALLALAALFGFGGGSGIGRGD